MLLSDNLEQRSSQETRMNRAASFLIGRSCVGHVPRRAAPRSLLHRVGIAVAALGLAVFSLTAPAPALAATATRGAQNDQRVDDGTIMFLPADLSLTIQVISTYSPPSAPFHIGIAIANSGFSDANGFDTSITIPSSFSHVRITDAGGFHCVLSRGIRNPTWGIGCTGDTLRAGAHTSIQVDGITPALFGPFTISGKVDTTGVVFELDKTNNANSLTINVG